MFSRALRQLHVTSSFDWFTGFSVFFVIFFRVITNETKISNESGIVMKLFENC